MIFPTPGARPPPGQKCWPGRSYLPVESVVSSSHSFRSRLSERFSPHHRGNCLEFKLILVAPGFHQCAQALIEGYRVLGRHVIEGEAAARVEGGNVVRDRLPRGDRRCFFFSYLRKKVHLLQGCHYVQ